MKGLRILGLVLLALIVITSASLADASGQPAARIRVHLSLPTRAAVAGRLIRGEILLTNTSARTIAVKACALNGWIGAGLSGHGATFPVGRVQTQVACGSSVRLQRGVNRFPVTVATTYPAYSTDGSAVARQAICTASGSAGFEQSPLVGQEGIAESVQPLARTVQ